MLRQKRILPSAAGTSIAEVPALTVKIVPRERVLRPAAVGRRAEARGSRQVPVQTFGRLGSILAFAWVSL